MTTPDPKARLFNFKTGEVDDLPMGGGGLFVDTDFPRPPADLSLYVPQDHAAQALLKAYLARRESVSTLGGPGSMTDIDVVTAVLEQTAHRPAELPPEKMYP